MQGVIPPMFVCESCRRNIFGADATIYEGMHFHDHCLPSFLSKIEAGYEKKARLGKITLAENKEYADIRYVNECVRKASQEPNLEKTFFPQMPRFIGHSRLSEESVRRKSLRASEERKRLGMSRKEYALFCSERNAKLKAKYCPDEKIMVAPGVAGEPSSCSECGRLTFCNDGLCHECEQRKLLKFNEKYLIEAGSDGKNKITV